MSAISGKLDITPANENKLTYIVPNGKSATINLNVCNRADTPRKINVLIVKGTHTAADLVEYQTLIPPKGILERTGLVMTAGEHLFIAAIGGDEVSVRYHGFEEEA